MNIGINSLTLGFWFVRAQCRKTEYGTRKRVRFSADTIINKNDENNDYSLVGRWPTNRKRSNSCGTAANGNNSGCTDDDRNRSTDKFFSSLGFTPRVCKRRAVESEIAI